MCRYQQMDTRLLRFSHKSYVTLIQMIIVWYFRLMMTSIKNAQNLHKQFGHASSNNLKNLFKKAELFSTEISKLINENCDNCVVCKTHKKPPPRPIVGLQKAKTLNHTVAMDLHSLDKNIWYFHIIEKFTRFSNATIIKSKSHTILIKNFLQNWVVFLAVHQKYLVIMGESFFWRVYRLLWKF